MAVLDGELDAALKATERSFHVRLIGTFAPDLICAPAHTKAASWLAKNYQDFDQFPVRDTEGTIGILLREGDHREKSVRQAMLPLSEGLLVSADMSIADLIPQLHASHFRLILRGGQIDGLVTQSDLLKLPVRMLLFGLISHLEMCLRAVIRERAPWPLWLKSLKPDRRKGVLSRLAKLKDARFEPDPLEFADFADAIDVLAQQPDLGDEFRREATPVQTLRNDIAHSKTFISFAADVRQFIDRFTKTRDLIELLSGMLKVAR
jgi:hypothetical protein